MSALADLILWVLRHFSPTALCEAHEKVHADRPTGDEARKAARRLRRFWPALLLLPQGNIKIRHALTLAGLAAETGAQPKTEAALRMLRRASRGKDRKPLPYIEGQSYRLYSQKSYEYQRKAFYSGSLLPAEFQAQEKLASLRALPTGEVPDTDTSRTDKVRPSEEEFFTCEAFTVWRGPGKYLLVWHDVRIRSWRFRWNLHVEDTFGITVRKAKDWPYWYTGWKNKKVSLAWRLWPARMEVMKRDKAGVTLRRGRREWTIKP